MSRYNGLRRAYARFHAYGILYEPQDLRQGCLSFINIQGPHLNVGYSSIDETLPPPVDEQQILHMKVSFGHGAGPFGANGVSYSSQGIVFLDRHGRSDERSWYDDMYCWGISFYL